MILRIFLCIGVFLAILTSSSTLWGTNAPDTHHAATKAHSSPVKADKDTLLGRLKAGNERFVHGTNIHPNQAPYTRKKLADGQKPSTIILSCSDSRVPPEVVFDLGLGDLFTIRTAGEIPDAAGVASIEYAVEHLGSQLLVVMGHESCGAVKAALTTTQGASAGSKDLDHLISEVQAHFKPSRSVATTKEDAKLAGPVKENVNGVIHDLMKRSHIIHEAVENGSLIVVPAIYSLDTGIVKFWHSSH